MFAVFHIIWAAGWYPLLNAEQARLAFATPWMYAYNVVVAAVCLIAVPVALAPVRGRGTSICRAAWSSRWRALDRRCWYSSRSESRPGGLCDGDWPVLGLGIEPLVLPGRRSIHAEHVALETDVG